MGVKFTPLAEGWGSPIGGTPNERGHMPMPALWHYYAGLQGLGGRFNSICQRFTFAAEGRLHETLPETAYLVCHECAEKLKSIDG